MKRFYVEILPSGLLKVHESEKRGITSYRLLLIEPDDVATAVPMPPPFEDASEPESEHRATEAGDGDGGRPEVPAVDVCPACGREPTDT